MTDKEQAKKIFFDYACSHFFMDHDGVGEKYKKFNITKSEEEEWHREYIAYWVSKLSTDDLFPLHRLRDAWASEALPSLIDLVNKGDSLARLWYANAIWELAKSLGVHSNIREPAIKVAKDTWHSLMTEELAFSPNHRAQIINTILPALNASTPEEYVRNYAKQELDEYEKWNQSKYKNIDLDALLKKELEKHQRKS